MSRCLLSNSTKLSVSRITLIYLVKSYGKNENVVIFLLLTDGPFLLVFSVFYARMVAFANNVKMIRDVLVKSQEVSKILIRKVFEINGSAVSTWIMCQQISRTGLFLKLQATKRALKTA